MSEDYGLNRFDRWTRGIVPVLSVFFMVLLSVTYLPLPFFSAVSPSLPLMAIYCWVVLRPDLMPRTAVFALGLLQDALTGVPLGLHAFVYLVAHPGLLAQRRFLVRHGYLSLWWGFALLAPSTSFLTWLLLSMLRGGLFAPFGVLTGLLAAVIAFPVIAWVVSRLRTVLPDVTETGAYA